MVDPETRASLMLRLQSPQDQEAWFEFVFLYEPLLLRVMQQRGLQEADARDVSQQVILIVSQSVQNWRSDGRQASFRRWLLQIARNHALRFLQRGRPFQRGVGGSDLLKLIHAVPQPESRTEADFDEAYRQESFRRAAERARGEFRESTWIAFWKTCVLNQPISAVADELGMSPGSIYVARSRIIARLRQIVEKYEFDHDT